MSQLSIASGDEEGAAATRNGILSSASAHALGDRKLNSAATSAGSASRTYKLSRASSFPAIAFVFARFLAATSSTARDAASRRAIGSSIFRAIARFSTRSTSSTVSTCSTERLLASTTPIKRASAAESGRRPSASRRLASQSRSLSSLARTASNSLENSDAGILSIARDFAARGDSEIHERRSGISKLRTSCRVRPRASVRSSLLCGNAKCRQEFWRANLCADNRANISSGVKFVTYPSLTRNVTASSSRHARSTASCTSAGVVTDTSSKLHAISTITASPSFPCGSAIACTLTSPPPRSLTFFATRRAAVMTCATSSAPPPSPSNDSAATGTL
eukprot:30294-Pelagococcus_subviridis.AAC.59